MCSCLWGNSFEPGAILFRNDNHPQCNCCNRRDRLCLDGTKRFHSHRPERYYSKLHRSNGRCLYGYRNGRSYLHRIYNRCCKSNPNDEPDCYKPCLHRKSNYALLGSTCRGFGCMDRSCICCLECLPDDSKRYGCNGRKLYCYCTFERLSVTADIASSGEPRPYSNAYISNYAMFRSDSACSNNYRHACNSNLYLDEQPTKHWIGCIWKWRASFFYCYE